MPELELQEVLADRREIEVPIAGTESTLTIVYAPNNMTPAQEESLRNIGRESELEGDTIIQFVIDLVTDWKLVSNGEPVPITKEALKLVPITVMGDVIAAIVEDTMGKAEARVAAWEDRTSGGS